MTSPSAATAAIAATGVGSSRNAASAPSRRGVDRSRSPRRRTSCSRSVAARRRPPASMPGEPLEGRAERATTSSRATAAPPSRQDGSNAARRAVRIAPPSRVQSPNRPAPPAAERRRSNASQRARRAIAGSTLEQLAEAGRGAADAVGAEPANDAMGRQDRQRLGGRLEEQHQQVVERRILLARSRSSAARRGSGAPSRSGGGRRRS